VESSGAGLAMYGGIPQGLPLPRAFAATKIGERDPVRLREAALAGAPED
jgi:hypothetical protein